ncbi:hypothetical protein [Marivirga arenosa]|uniref:PH domain-containing protein n=1 Tax=Marivirga arenosa TaxID=3059076 RepID=A0AA51ZWR7_9BACT|nr:hypothetical protein [Marivirga sp. BKB1-2]WNB18164.1 hypothetical protein QYS47_29385 [Marivirga sp. BKB1-2]
MLPLLMLFSIPIAYYVKGYSWEESLIVGPLFNFSAFILLGCIPTFLIHRSHYINNKDFSLFVDKISGKITINEDKQYDIDSLEFIEHLAISKKRQEDGKFRLITPWSNYSYLKVITPDNNQYKISSNVVCSSELPIRVHSREYTLWPSIR